MEKRNFYKLDDNYKPHLIDFSELRKGDRFQIVDEAIEDQHLSALGYINADDIARGVYRVVSSEPEPNGGTILANGCYPFPKKTSKNNKKMEENKK